MYMLTIILNVQTFKSEKFLNFEFYDDKYFELQFFIVILHLKLLHNCNQFLIIKKHLIYTFNCLINSIENQILLYIILNEH